MTVVEADAPLPPVHVRRVINAAPDEVFAAWTDPTLLAKWLGSPEVRVEQAAVDAREGGTYRVHMRGMESGRLNELFGTYTEITPPTRLAFTWQFVRQGGEVSPESIVHVDFVPVDGSRTEVRLTHALLPSEDDRRGVKRGWGSSLEKLDALLAPTHPTEG